MKHFHISRGEPQDSHVGTEPRIETVTPVQSAFLGRDYPGLRPRFLVDEGEEVRTGQPVFVDRKHPEIVYASPVSGVISAISYGPRRTLSVCVVTLTDVGPASEPLAEPDDSDPKKLRQTLQSRGLWPAFRTRPFGCVPAPDAVPSAILVNAVRATRQSPDPNLVLADQRTAFERGALLLARLTDGQVHLCQSPGNPLGPKDARIVHSSFSGTKGAGLAGTQIDALCPVDHTRTVWSIGYQDVAAIGHLFETGAYQPDRVISVTNRSDSSVRFIRTSLGARTIDLGAPPESVARSGGREALYIGRHDIHVHYDPIGRPAWRPSWRDRLFFRQTALIPTEAICTALSLDLLTVPLLRALSVGDTESARRLGCLALIEEDLAAASGLCTSGVDYGALLRHVLDDLKMDTT